MVETSVDRPSKRLLLVDDHTMVRKGLRVLLESRLGYEVVGEAAEGRAAIEKARQLKPDVVILDAAMPGLGGAGAAMQISRDCENICVIALSMHSEKQYVSSMLKAGASAYLLKTCDLEELHLAIETALSGRIYLSPEVALTVVEGYINPQADSAESRLTRREIEILQLLAEGKNSKEIGAILHVSSRTVDSHRQRFMEKLGLYSVAELTKYALREGMAFLDC